MKRLYTEDVSALTDCVIQQRGFSDTTPGEVRERKRHTLLH